MSAPSSRAVARRRRVGVLVVVLVVIGVAGWMVMRSAFLDVDHLVVSGNARVSVEEILASSGVEPGDAMVWLDASGTASSIEAMPWIRRADVKREWPSTVRIVVHERVPVAWVDAGEGRALVVDRDGHGVSIDALPPAGLPQLLDVASAPVGEAISPAGGARLAGHLTAEQLAIVRSIKVTDARATLVVTSGQEVRFGRLNQVGDKMRSAVAVLAQSSAEGRTYIDVSAPSTPVAG